MNFSNNYIKAILDLHSKTQNPSTLVTPQPLARDADLFLDTLPSHVTHLITRNILTYPGGMLCVFPGTHTLAKLNNP